MNKALLISAFALILLTSFPSTGQHTVSLTIDHSIQFQRIDGFGVNVNTRSWSHDELKPALDFFLDSMNLEIWRVVAETEKGWEEINDNADPFVFNWDYYDKLYETEPFRKVWSLIGYLNDKGVAGNQVMINLMGQIPGWMGKSVVNPLYEDEYVEMLVSFIYYARVRHHLGFGLFSPMNEPDIKREGPTVGPVQYASILRKLIDRMQALHLDIRLVGPDVAGMKNGIDTYLPEMMKDSVIMTDLYRAGLHSYNGYSAEAMEFLQSSKYPNTGLWMTEFNAWRDGLDDGQVGLYDYTFASQSAGYVLDLVRHGASACLVWEGYDSYYDHHAPSLFSYWGILGYDPASRTYFPRKHVAAMSQFSKFVHQGYAVVKSSETPEELPVVAFYDSSANAVTVVGINKGDEIKSLQMTLASGDVVGNARLAYTDADHDLAADGEITNEYGVKAVIPANCIFTLTATIGVQLPQRVNPEPGGWYAGDIHVHRNCGDDSVLPENDLTGMMEPNDLAVISVLADMGNGEVKYSQEDLLKVSGKDVPQSDSGRIVHWDAEWHWDATYTQFDQQALGGHLVLLGLKEAHQIWDESPYKILDWARKQQAIGGFCHFEYLNDKVQNDLNCCIPIEYPVEAALGTMDFISEDVYARDSPNNGAYNSEAAMHAYYRLLNCGFRLGLAAGTDYPCNNGESLGSLLTYVQVKDEMLTYEKWIQGIKNGRTVISRNGHHEFLELKINDTFQPGDETKLEKKDAVNIEVVWSADETEAGNIELLLNGNVIASDSGMAGPGSPRMLRATHEITESSWVCARRMDATGHQSHTAPVYITVNEKPVRASAADAQYFVAWIDNLLINTSPAGPWRRFFTHDLDVARRRYRDARKVYYKVYKEARQYHPQSNRK